MLIGELAAEAGTTTRALRYYEEQGLLESDRTTAGYRLYEPGAVRRVRNIRELLSCGFTVEDVKSLLAYLDADLPEVFSYSPLCADGYGVGAQRVSQLEERIAILTELRDSLVHRMPWLAAPGGTADGRPLDCEVPRPFRQPSSGVRGQEVVLPDDVFQLFGTRAVGDWPGGLLVEERQGHYGRFHRSLGSQAGVCGRGEPLRGTLTSEGSAVRGEVRGVHRALGRSRRGRRSATRS